jgi:hypothetical protein
MNHFTIKDIPEIKKKEQSYDELFDDCDLSDEMLAEADQKIDVQKLTNVCEKMEKSQLSNNKGYSKRELEFVKTTVNIHDQSVNKSKTEILELKSLALDKEGLDIIEGNKEKSTTFRKCSLITQEISGLLRQLIKNKSENFTDRRKLTYAQDKFDP